MIRLPLPAGPGNRHRQAGRRLLSPASVRLMTTDHLTQPQRDGSGLFLEGQGWGFGGSVDIAAVDPWNVPGRYGEGRPLPSRSSGRGGGSR